jgi:NSS family neurotransmitter:Na+ symporter
MHPIVGRIVGGSFFLMLCFAALTSTISMLEVPTAYLVDQKKLPRKTVVWSLAAGIFILGMPSMLSQGTPGFEFLNKLAFYKGKDFLTFISDTADMGLTIGGCLMCIFITYRWKINNMNEELSLGNEGYMQSFLKKYISFTIQYICPLLLGILSILIIYDKFFGLNKFF